MSSPISVQILGPRIGAEVLKLDLADPLSAPTLQALEAALLRHEALVLHVPDMTPDQHLAIARHFGEAEVHTFYPIWGRAMSKSQSSTPSSATAPICGTTTRAFCPVRPSSP